MAKITPREEIEQFKQRIDITNYLKDAGYSLDKERDTPQYRAFSHEGSGDKVYIPINKKYPNPNFYVNQYDNQDRGTILDFVMTRQQTDMDGAREVLRNYAGGYTATVREVGSTPAVESQDDSAKRRRQLFIVQKITESESAVDEPYLQKRLLTHDTRHHAAFQDVVKLNEAPDARFVAFPLKNESGKVEGVAMKSSTKERFLGNRQGAWVSAPTLPGQPVDRAIITEDPVDAMSYHQLRGRATENLVYISPAGNPSERQLQVIKNHILKLAPKDVTLANDNDVAGKKYDQKYQQSLASTNIAIHTEKPAFKDWNADLVAEQVYRTRLLDRSNHQPEQLTNPNKEKTPPQIEQIINDRTTRHYPSFAGDPALPNYYVERSVDRKQVEFSLSEVAYINKDKKLGHTLGVNVDQGYLLSQSDKSASLSASAKQEGKKLALESNPLRANAQVKSITDKIAEGKAASQTAVDYTTEVRQKTNVALSSTDATRSTSETTSTKTTNESSLQDQYTQRLNSLRGQIKDQPGSEKMLRQLDYYTRYPHLKDSEVENYATAQETVIAHQQGKSMTRGKQIERGL